MSDIFGERVELPDGTHIDGVLGVGDRELDSGEFPAVNPDAPDSGEWGAVDTGIVDLVPADKPGGK